MFAFVGAGSSEACMQSIPCRTLSVAARTLAFAENNATSSCIELHRIASNCKGKDGPFTFFWGGGHVSSNRISTLDDDKGASWIQLVVMPALNVTAFLKSFNPSSR
jgi:hypothetical protein